MKELLLTLFLTINSVFAFCQRADLTQKIETLQNFMNTHIPDMNSGILHFQMTVEKGNLIVETFTDVQDDEDETSYTKEFDLKDNPIILEKFKLSKEESDAYGYSLYWEVSVGNKFLLSNIESKNDAEKLVDLLKDIKSQL
ncbi:hypothetical protein [Fluviicola sp.]|uniref:hypothetical protein n=1 Tax=Fluviicola sp. TaxID=1917219 RepID=UPI00260C3018|nr:hypothetical protein [Fluviicola sp.]